MKSDAMAHITFAEFEANSRAAGVDEVLERVWAPDTAIESPRSSWRPVGLSQAIAVVA